MSKIYHVSKKGSLHNPGSEDKPFLTINQAASIALPGDQVIVHEGIYRECVNPKYSGLSEKRRITYKAAKGERVCIKGSEQVTDWQNVEGNVWKTVIPNSLFTDFNPFAEILRGDWLYYFRNECCHRGDVYLNGMSLYEAASLDELYKIKPIKESLDHWTEKTVPVKNIDQTLYRWYAAVDDTNTTIWANFQSYNPNNEDIEVSVRESCFYPKLTGINYITVSGFEMSQAATPWTPPTADQPGMIGPHWSKGWIIENNILHDAKCAAVSLGKEERTGRNYRLERKDKPGYNYQLETVFEARRLGWDKETIGSHIIRDNVIYNCEQCGIVGHMGGAFSKIYNNHIYNIGIKREFYGYEVGGIKLHAAIDTEIIGNRIHDCSLGTWLDWQTQGVRISRNLYYNNCRDLFVEVSHGPYTVDFNIFASPQTMDDMAQGGAFVNNLFLGYILHSKILDRATPYHLPHSTKIKGCAVVYGGDHRFMQNIFVSNKDLDKPVGTSIYNGYNDSLEHYIDEVQQAWPGDLAIFLPVEQPVYIENNSYYNGADKFEKEEGSVVITDFDPCAKIYEEEDGLYLNITLPETFGNEPSKIISSDDLPRVRIADADYENSDGSFLVLNKDYFNEPITKGLRGPIQGLQPGINKVRLCSYVVD